MYLLGIPETVLYRRMSGQVSPLLSFPLLIISRELLIASEAPIPFSTALWWRREPLG
jgi:hypothetical protein